LEPALIVCPQCEETGCESCGFSGRFEIKHCPQKDIESGYLDFVEMAACFKKGILPIEGGVLDQDSWFIRAARFLDSQESILRPSMGD